MNIERYRELVFERIARGQDLEAELMVMRKAGLLVFTNGIAWRPKAK